MSYNEDARNLHLTETDKQFILYTKGHYKNKPSISDAIKIFTASQFRLPLEDVHHRNMASFSIKLYTKLIDVGVIPFDKSPLESLLREIFKEKDYSIIQFFEKMHADIQFMDVVDFDLPDIIDEKLNELLTAQYNKDQDSLHTRKKGLMN